MKKICGILILFLLASICCGCGKEEEKQAKRQQLQMSELDLSELPMHHIAMTDEENFHGQVPDEKLITETVGEIMDVSMDEDYIYYFILYDYYYTDLNSEVGICRQAFSSEKIEEIFYSTDVSGFFFEFESFDVHDGEFSWCGGDREGKSYKYVVKDGQCIVESDEKPLENDLTELFKKYHISGSCTDGSCRLIGNNSEYIVWEQWEEDYFNDCYIQIYHLNDGTLDTINKEDYGDMYRPAFYEGVLCFQTIDDIKSYSEPKDFYANIYIYDIGTKEDCRITNNYGNEDSLDTEIYSEPKATAYGILFTEREKKGEVFTYKKAHIIR